MNESPRIAEQIQKMLPGVKAGTLRFWGVWFGRPHDNLHRLLECAATDDVLRMRFNEDEVLTVGCPKGLTMDDSTFQISDAERVRWEWFNYGRPKTNENLFFYDFVKVGRSVAASSNVNWYRPDMRTNSSLPAVEIL
jgi:hypothetical protein